MADPVTPSAPPAPAAPALKPSEHQMPFEIGNLTHEAVMDDDQDDGTTPPPETPPEPPAPPKPARLAKFRNPDGTLNEDLIEQVERSAQESGAVASEIQRAYNNDPVYRLNYIKWRQSTGQELTAAQHAELSAAKAPAAADPTKPPPPTMAQITARYNELAVTDPGAAQRLWHEYVTLPELKKRDDALAERDARDADNRTRAEQASYIQTIKGELSSAATTYPGLVIADASLPQGYRIMNDAVYAEVLKLMPLKGESMASRIDMALYRLKMTPPAKQAAKPDVKPTVPVSAPRTTAPPRKLKPNEHAVPAFIVGDENFA